MKLKITVHGMAYEVDVEVLDEGEGFASALPTPAAPRPPLHAVGGPAPASPPPPSPPAPAAAAAAAGQVASPIAGVVVEIKVRPGEAVTEGQVLLVVEAMKMNTDIAAPAAGTIGAVHVAAGDGVREGQPLVDLA